MTRARTGAKRTSMTEGSILRALLFFAFPILIGNIFQQCYNIVDTAVIGNLLGDDKLAAVGAAAPIYSLVISFANGMTNGFSVVIARFCGAGDTAKMKRAITFSYLLTAGISAALTVFGMIGIKPLLVFLNTPSEIIADAESYLRVILLFSAVTMFYNMFAGMFRAIGNSRIPLYFLVIATALNVILDILFVKYLGLGVAGAGYATAEAQAASVALCVLAVRKKFVLLKFDGASLKRDKRLLGDLSVTGLSMGLMLAVVSIGSVAMQNAVNSLGKATVTAHTAARKFGDIFMLVLGTVSLSASTFASQNYGAGNMGRVKRGILTSMAIGAVWSAVSAVCAFTIARPAVKALTGTDSGFVINTAVKYIQINLPFFFVLNILLILRSSLQGLGRKLVPICGSVIELAGKFAAAFFIAPMAGYVGICFLEPAIWIVCAVVVLVDFRRFLARSARSASQEYR
ncbi:MAG: MATE family efflux transporter [Butyrivibrio sp.]|nr:MATE family efflux transporter [Butyrivibrio sp.]